MLGELLSSWLDHELSSDETPALQEFDTPRTHGEVTLEDFLKPRRQRGNRGGRNNRQNHLPTVKDNMTLVENETQSVQRSARDRLPPTAAPFTPANARPAGQGRSFPATDPTARGRIILCGNHRPVRESARSFTQPFKR